GGAEGEVAAEVEAVEALVFIDALRGLARLVDHLGGAGARRHEPLVLDDHDAADHLLVVEIHVRLDAEARAQLARRQLLRQVDEHLAVGLELRDLLLRERTRGHLDVAVERLDVVLKSLLHHFSPDCRYYTRGSTKRTATTRLPFVSASSHRPWLSLWTAP